MEGVGSLDQCNGRTDADGNYAYYTTDNFPYILGCFKGGVDLDAAGGGNRRCPRWGSAAGRERLVERSIARRSARSAAASEVLQNQAIEVGMMRAWFTDWGQSAASPELSMGWMDVNDGAGMPLAMMPGLASDDEMRGLSHAAVRLGSAPKVLRMTSQQSRTQTYEISQYDFLLAGEYA